MDHGSLLHTRSRGMREPSQRRSGEEDHDAVSSGADGTRAGTVPGASRGRGRTAQWSTPEASPLLENVKASVSVLLKEPWSWNREYNTLGKLDRYKRWSMVLWNHEKAIQCGVQGEGSDRGNQGDEIDQ
jgi:hypothetical protein